MARCWALSDAWMPVSHADCSLKTGQSDSNEYFMATKCGWQGGDRSRGAEHAG